MLGCVVFTALAMFSLSSVTWVSYRIVRRLRPDEVVFPAMVGMSFIATVNQISAAERGPAMSKFLWRPVVSVSDAGITIWFGWFRPMPGLFLPRTQLARIDEAMIDSPATWIRGDVPGIRLSLAIPNSGLEFTATRAIAVAPIRLRQNQFHNLYARITTQLRDTTVK